MNDNTNKKNSDAFDFSYLSENEITSITNLISELKSEGIFLSNSLYDNNWLFSHEHSPGRIIKLDFKKIIIDLNPDELLLIKWWIVSLLEKYQPSTCIHYFHHFSKAVNITNFFSLDRLDYFIEWLLEDHISDNDKSYVLSNIFSFFDFSEIPNASNYLAKLYDISNKIKFTSNPVQLPSSKFILLFSYYLERYFSDIETDDSFKDIESSKKKILYYPILIWWNLTTILPLRSTEFCLIKRNCLSKVNNKYFIKITRIKVSFDQKFEINEKMYNLLNDYIEYTNEYGESKTLVSYRSLIYADNTGRRKLQKRDLDSFNKNNLEKLLQRFYKEVINKYYLINIPQHQKLSPNDTRHIAFISLMMQGVSPVEIAHLGGHKTIAAQYHYSFHKEYWIDNEVFKLIKNYKSTSKFDHNIHYIPENIKLNAFKPPTSSFRGELELGYCSDHQIRCESNECMLCSHWRIDLNELQNKHDLIILKINKHRNNLIELMNFFYKLHTKKILNVTAPGRLESETEIKQKFQKIKSELHNLSKLTQYERSIY